MNLPCRVPEKMASPVGSVVVRVEPKRDQQCNRLRDAPQVIDRPNCYYELGWAYRAKKDVILTTHASTPIHFDVKDYNFIVYESASELHERLLWHVRESIGLNVCS
jgi:hypothetical protein